MRKPPNKKKRRKPTVQESPCRRCGKCCQYILAGFSPAILRESFRAWKAQKGQVLIFKDVYLLYPMLAGRCRGKLKIGEHIRYVYAPCKHLEFVKQDGKRVAVCTIYPNWPDMCKGYPCYAHPQAVEMSLGAGNNNPGYMKGCGWNADRSAGHAPAEFMAEKLEPLEEGEK